MTKPLGNPDAESNTDAEGLVDEAVEALEEAWQSGAIEGISRFVPSQGHFLRERILVELIKVDQEYHCASGNPRLIEAYLEDWPELSDKRDVLRELVSAECLTRATFGSLPTAAELESRFPEISRQIDLGAIAAQIEREQCDHPDDDETADTAQEMAGQTPARGLTLPPLPVGQIFGRDGRYEIRKLLGQGGMGSVYRAFDTRLGRDVALKIPRVDPATEPAVVKRFVRESQAAARIHHPNICPIFDADQFEGIFYLTMAFIEGQSLAEWERHGAVEPRKAAEVAGKLARALAVIHSQGIVHRDIKPSNVMVDDSGETFLMDFGLASLAQEERGAATAETVSAPRSACDSRLTHTGILLGTVPYMSPEQTCGEAVEASSDVYSLGVLFYEALAGRRPFQGKFEEIRNDIRYSAPPDLRALCPNLDLELEATCLRALAKNPADRPSAAEFASAIDRYLQAEPPASGPTRRHRGPTLVAGGALFALLAIVFLVNSGRRTTVVQPNGSNATISNDGKRGDPEGNRGAVGVGQVTNVLPIEHWIDTPPKAVGVQLSRDGVQLYAAFNEYPSPSRVQAFDVASGRLLRSITSPDDSFDHKGLALSGDDRYVYVTNYFRPDISRIDLRDNGRRTNLRIGGVPGAVWATTIAITPDKQKLVVAVGDDGRLEDLNNDQISIVDVAGEKFSLAGEVPLSDEVPSLIAVSSDSTLAYLVTRPRKSPAPSLCEVRLTPPYEVRRRLPQPGSQLTAVAVANGMKRAFLSDTARQKIRVVDLETFQTLSELGLNGYGPGALAFSGGEELLCVLSPESRKLFILEPRDGTLLARVDGLREGAAGIDSSPDYRRLFVWHNASRGGVAVIPIGNLRGGLVFASNRGGEGYQIYRTLPGQKEPVRLTNNHATDRCPRWSPDGCNVAYVSTSPGLPRICLVHGRGGEPRVLEATDPSLFEQGTTLDWSPDGTEIAFIADRGRAIRLVEVGTGRIRSLVEGQLAEGYGFHTDLCWKRKDGLILVNCQSPLSSRQKGTFLLEPKTRHVTQLMSSGGDWLWYAGQVSSPDGKKIAALRPPGASRAAEKIYLADSDGKDWKCLVGTETQYRTALRWSGDGSRLVYSAVADNRYHVFLVDVHGGKPVQITQGDCDDIGPDIYGDEASMAKQ